ncbi:hypothetical protein J7J26_00430 [Candidatus Micrarchaeota archaeon]|nr:hypothetical protein [Candidatus Micrarchaeota archaeon]
MKSESVDVEQFSGIIMAMIIISLLLLHFKQYLISALILGLAGVLTIPLGFILLYETYKIITQAEKQGKKKKG